MAMHSQNLKMHVLDGDNYTTHNHCKDGQIATLEDSDGAEPNALKDTTTITVIACVGEPFNLCSRFSRQPRGLRLRGGATDVNRICVDLYGASDTNVDKPAKTGQLKCHGRMSPNSGLAQELSSDCA